MSSPIPYDKVQYRNVASNYHKNERYGSNTCWWLFSFLFEIRRLLSVPFRTVSFALLSIAPLILSQIRNAASLVNVGIQNACGGH